LLEQGAKAHGWPNQLWTAARVAVLVRRHFGVRYHPDHLRRALRARLGWTSQKPRRRAKERDEDGISRSPLQSILPIGRETWPRPASLARRDSHGVHVQPCARLRLAPPPPPTFWASGDRRHRIAAISCITISPQARRLNLPFQLLPDNVTVHGEDVVA